MYQPSRFPKNKKPPTLFNSIEAEVAARQADGQNVYAMHVGDTFMPTPAPMLQPVENEDQLFGSNLNRYGNTFGELALRSLLLEKVQQKNHIPVEDVDSIQVTAGATAALEACFSRLIEPGSEVLVLSPYWTILRQVAEQAKVQIVEVPVFDKLAENPDLDLFELLNEYGRPWTKAIYLNTPSNPTGMLLNQKQLEAIGRYAQRRDLWLFSDEAYEDFIFDGGEHVSIASLPNLLERTVSVFTFSKNLSTSGLRLGYAVGAPAVIAEINRGVVGGYYHAGRFDQLMAWRGMKNFDECLQPLFNAYKSNWQWAKDNLRVKSLPVSAGFYFFIWLGEDWKALMGESKIKRMLDHGLVLSPGESFGNEYNGWARVCFSILPPDDLKLAVERINEMVGA